MNVSLENANRADLLVESITDCAIFMLDPDGRVSSWNAGAGRITGYAADTVLGEAFSRFYPESDRAAGMPERALGMAREAGRFETECWLLRKDGTRFCANIVIDPIQDDRDRHVGFATIMRDLTERREAEEALRRSEERFRLLVQGVTDYAIYMLDPEGRVSSWNAGAERFKGYTENEIIGEHFSRFYPEEDRAAGVPQRALQTARDEGRFEAEGWRLRKDGSRFWASVVIDPIRDIAGELIGYTKITRDLTERKRAQEQMFQAQKMEALGKLTGGVAHDFNNILAAIIGSISIATKRTLEDQDAAPFLANALQAAERGATLTQRMLAFARKQELQLEAVDVVECVRDMANLLSRTLGPQISIALRFPLTLPPVLADRAQLELAIMNLMVNARDAMPEGGQIVLSAREAEDDGEKMVYLGVEDEGEGMDADTLTRATEPFFTTKGVGKGTGLGLSMVQGMVEQSGGRISIHSAPGEGTTVGLWFPVAEISMTRAEPPVTSERRRGGVGRLRILVVDDDPIILLNTAEVLADMGHEVIEAHSGMQALEIGKDSDFDLVISDFSMPGMSGAELIERLRLERADLKAILATGYADLPNGVKIDLPRLAKPYTDADLNARIAEVIEA